jgi:transcriptional regulator with XRE-family HTH domain
MTTILGAVDLATITGRIVAALRHEQGATQATLAGRMRWDRSLLARVEAGRNTATIDNLFELEEVFLADGLVRRHGDLVELVGRIVHEAKRRGLSPVVGRTGEQPSAETALVDRIVARVVDDWLLDLEGQLASGGGSR